MAEKSSIEWTEATWNPITGCTLVSDGCRHCYAARLAATRLKHLPSRKGLARLNAAGEAKFTGEVRFNEEWLDQPLRWKRPRMIFTCAHGDLFHESVPDEWIDNIFAVMALAPQHTFQVLTKRSKRMRAYLADFRSSRRVYEAVCEMACDMATADQFPAVLLAPGVEDPGLMPAWPRVRLGAWPLTQVWLGVSAEDQATANERILDLLATPAAIRFVSAEPLLGPIDFTALNARPGVKLDSLHRYIATSIGDGFWDHRATTAPGLDQIIVGGESGENARPMNPDWARSIRDQSKAAEVAFFFKQWGEYLPVGQTLPGHGKIHGATAVSPGRMKLHYGGTSDQPPQHAFAERGVGFSSTPDGCLTFQVGKKAAGRLLDGVEHNAMPELRS